MSTGTLLGLDCMLQVVLTVGREYSQADTR